MNNHTQKEFPSAKVIAHSKAPNGEELITMEIELHRFILPEFNTHRVFSRNFQSSRAVPVEKMIEQVRTSPAIPIHWGKNQRGMVANEDFKGETAEHIKGRWLIAAKKAADEAEYLSNLNVHKQLVNRLLEPFMKTKGVVTATREAFEGFFKLRSHKDAQPEIKALSDKMMRAVEDSVPEGLFNGEYHLPYVNWYRIQHEDGSFEQILHTPVSNLDLYTTEDAIKISASCCAQVSYRVLDDSIEKALKVYNMLNLPERGDYPEDPPHFSPTEHIAKVVEDFKHEDYMSGNFVTGTFWQYRKALEKGKEGEFIK